MNGNVILSSNEFRMYVVNYRAEAAVRFAVKIAFGCGFTHGAEVCDL